MADGKHTPDAYRIVQNVMEFQVWERDTLLSVHKTTARAKTALKRYRQADARRAAIAKATGAA